MKGVHQGALLRSTLLCPRKQVYFLSCWNLCKYRAKFEGNPYVDRFETPLFYHRDQTRFFMHKHSPSPEGSVEKRGWRPRFSTPS